MGLLYLYIYKVQIIHADVRHYLAPIPKTTISRYALRPCQKSNSLFLALCIVIKSYNINQKMYLLLN